MIYETISNFKYKPEFKLLTYLVIISFITSLVGCTASETLRVESENITNNMNYELTEVIMKDGTVINLKGKSPRYLEEWENKKNVILYSNDTIWISEKKYTISDETKEIELDNVRWVTLERVDKEVEVTVATKNGKIHKGGLLSVSDDKISLCNKKVKNNVTVIAKDSVERVLIHGDNKIFTSLGYGALIGTGTGVLLGFAVGDIKGPTPAVFFGSTEEATHSSSGQNALIGGSIGALLGGLIGVIVGIINSTPDKTIAIFSDDDYYKLMRYIKHSSYDPLNYMDNKKNNK